MTIADRLAASTLHAPAILLAARLAQRPLHERIRAMQALPVPARITAAVALFNCQLAAARADSTGLILIWRSISALLVSCADASTDAVLRSMLSALADTAAGKADEMQTRIRWNRPGMRKVSRVIDVREDGTVLS